MSDDKALLERLDRIALALERLAPPAPAAGDLDAADAFVWHADASVLQAVATVNRVPLDLLKGIDGAARQLLDNTRRFAEALPANNALLWGARGMGKSSLVKAVHAEACAGLRSARAGERGRPQAHRDSSRGHRLASRLPRAAPQRRGIASSSSVTTSPSTGTTRATNRSRPFSKAGSRGVPTTSSFTRHRTGAT